MRAAVVSAVACLLSGGCFHLSSPIPGVLDLRSDGSEAPIETGVLPPSEATRDGVGAFFLGAGAQGSGEVHVENRATFVGLSTFFLVHPLNGGVDDEWKAVLGKGGAARNVFIGEKIGGMTAASEAVRACVCAPLFVFTPVTLDITGQATRIQPVTSGRDEPVGAF